jgi:hypothetical protein
MFVARALVTDYNGAFIAEKIIHDPMPSRFNQKLEDYRKKCRETYERNYYFFVNMFTDAQVKKFIRENPGVDEIQRAPLRNISFA